MTLELSRPLPYASMACIRQEQVIYQLETAERALLLVHSLLAGQGAGERIQPACVLKNAPLAEGDLKNMERGLTPEETVRQIGETLQQLRTTLLQGRG